MQLLLIAGFALMFAAVVFALQNTDLITIRLFAWRVEGSLAIVLLTRRMMPRDAILETLRGVTPALDLVERPRR